MFVFLTFFFGWVEKSMKSSKVDKVFEADKLVSFVNEVFFFASVTRLERIFFILRCVWLAWKVQAEKVCQVKHSVLPRVRVDGKFEISVSWSKKIEFYELGHWPFFGVPCFMAINKFQILQSRKNLLQQQENANKFRPIFFAHKSNKQTTDDESIKSSFHRVFFIYLQLLVAVPTHQISTSTTSLTAEMLVGALSQCKRNFLRAFKFFVLLHSFVFFSLDHANRGEFVIEIDRKNEKTGKYESCRIYFQPEFGRCWKSFILCALVSLSRNGKISELWAKHWIQLGRCWEMREKLKVAG